MILLNPVSLACSMVIMASLIDEEGEVDVDVDVEEGPAELSADPATTVCRMRSPSRFVLLLCRLGSMGYQAVSKQDAVKKSNVDPNERKKCNDMSKPVA